MKLRGIATLVCLLSGKCVEDPIAEALAASTEAFTTSCQGVGQAGQGLTAYWQVRDTIISNHFCI